MGDALTGRRCNGQPRAVILVVGDSLSAEYGLARGSGWVALLEQRLAREKIAAKVVNASVSGDTTSGGRSRLPALLAQHKPTHVILELGGNDALRGLPLKHDAGQPDGDGTCGQGGRRARRARRHAGAAELRPPVRRRLRRRLFADVAKSEGARWCRSCSRAWPTAPDAEAMFQADRIHPKEAAHPIMLGNVWPVLRPLLPKEPAAAASVSVSRMSAYQAQFRPSDSSSHQVARLHVHARRVHAEQLPRQLAVAVLPCGRA